MSVRFSASGQGYSRTTAYPSMPFTILQWVYMVTDRNAVSGLWGVSGNFSPNGLVTDADGTTLRLKSGTVNSIGPAAITAGAWWKVATVASGTTATIFYGLAGAALSSVSGTFSNPSLPSAFRIGSSDTTADFFNGRIGPQKEWAAALTLAELNQEFSCIMPVRTVNLTAWYPWMKPETVDYSGNARTLSGGTGATVESNSPIPWRIGGHQHLLIPWDSGTPVWFAIYNDTTGDLVSGDYSTNVTLPLDAGFAYKTYLGGPPNPDVFGWSSEARDYVFLEGIIWVDRVSDLLADGTLSAAWAALSGPQSAAMQARIGQMLGPYRYRRDYQDIDLQLGFGTPQ